MYSSPRVRQTGRTGRVAFSPDAKSLTLSDYNDKIYLLDVTHTALPPSPSPAPGVLHSPSAN